MNTLNYQTYQYDAVERQKKAQKAEVAKQVQKKAKEQMMYSYQQFQYDAVERQKKAQKAEIAKQIHQDSQPSKQRR